MEKKRRHSLPTPRHVATQSCVLVVIPCHRESKAVVIATLASVARSRYNSECMHIFLSMDGEENLQLSIDIAKELEILVSTKNRMPVVDSLMGSIRLTICVFGHGGKHGCLASTIEFIQRHHGGYFASSSDTHVLMLDSDTMISEDAIAVSATTLVSKL
jgi:cellulose synthase/poly-beta-1,6-N-acetylglucosamine synthase-like glycosyltransferase